jgi:hypothetical protein
MTEQEQLLITKYDLLFESRLSKVEATMDYMYNHMTDSFKEIKYDIRWMFGIMIAFHIGTLGLMAKGFHWFT